MLINPIESTRRAHNRQCEKKKQQSAHMCTEALESVIDCAGAPLHEKKPSERAAELLINKGHVRSVQPCSWLTRSRRSRVSVEHRFCDPLLHKLNKTNTKLPDKIRGNHGSRWTSALPCSTCRPKQSESKKQLLTALCATREVSPLSIWFDIFESTCLIVSNPTARRTRIKKAVASSTVDRQRIRSTSPVSKRTPKRRAAHQKEGPIKHRIEKKRTWSALKRRALDPQHKMRSGAQCY